MISVVIPVYNAVRYLPKAVESAVKQNTETELILVDDCSADASCEVLIGLLREKNMLTEERGEDGIFFATIVYQGRRIPLTKVRHKKRLGAAEARNTGAALAAGEYVALLDADDVWAEGKLVKQLALLEKTGAPLCNTAHLLILENGKSTGHVIHTPARIQKSDIERTNLINCSSVLIRRELLLHYPMKHSDAAEDYLTWLLLLSEVPYAVGIDEPLLFYRLNRKGKSANKLAAARMHYKSYLYAGYGRGRAAWLMLSYISRGIKKYSEKSR